MSKWKSSKTSHFRRFQAKWIADSNSAYFFTYFNTGQNYFSTFFSKMSFFDIRIIKNCMFLMFWRLGTMLERFVIAKSFWSHISKLKDARKHIFDISKVRKSPGRGLLAKQNCILSKKIVPQGPFGQNIW